eukprot:TRINITY_DN62813_c0_g1_i1.p1 TRINITY_DN62813_c0_g1~~TRINITY_DN62813_c0_g1_i1.p1  ORF type:complete len:884 (-),score=151.53 TRINITY_DN62813_c0_g1_i1:69-2690(-)
MASSPAAKAFAAAFAAKKSSKSTGAKAARDGVAGSSEGCSEKSASKRVLRKELRARLRVSTSVPLCLPRPSAPSGAADPAESLSARARVVTRRPVTADFCSPRKNPKLPEGPVGPPPQMTTRRSRSVPVADILERLRTCDSREFEGICEAIARQAPHVEPGEVPLSLDALAGTLQSQLGKENAATTSAVLDEVGASWSSVRLLPHDTLSSLLKLLLKGLNRDSRGEANSCLVPAGDCRPGMAALRSRSSPGGLGRTDVSSVPRLNLAPLLMMGASDSPNVVVGRGMDLGGDQSVDVQAEPECPEAAAWIRANLSVDPSKLPASEVRLLQVLLRLIKRGVDAKAAAAGSVASGDGDGNWSRHLGARHRVNEDKGVDTDHVGAASRRVSADSPVTPGPPPNAAASSARLVASSASASLVGTGVGYPVAVAAMRSEPSRGRFFDGRQSSGNANIGGGSAHDGQNCGVAFHNLASGEETSVEFCSEAEGSVDWLMGNLHTATTNAAEIMSKISSSTDAPTGEDDWRRPLPEALKLAQNDGVVRRSRCRSLPAALRRAKEGVLSVVATPRQRPAYSNEWTDEDRCSLAAATPRSHATWRECLELRRNQSIVMRTLQDTSRMVTEMHMAVLAEREEKERQRIMAEQESSALRSQLSAMTSQMQMLTQGQLQLQQCMAALCLAQGIGGGGGQPGGATSGRSSITDFRSGFTEEGLEDSDGASGSEDACRAGVRASPTPPIRGRRRLGASVSSATSQDFSTFSATASTATPTSSKQPTQQKQQRYSNGRCKAEEAGCRMKSLSEVDNGGDDLGRRRPLAYGRRTTAPSVLEDPFSCTSSQVPPSDRQTAGSAKSVPTTSVTASGRRPSVGSAGGNGEKAFF